METIFRHRREHGECFVTRLFNGLEIPWNPLSLKEYIEYDLEFKIGRIPAATLEDEIFKKCVLDSHTKMNIDILDAGIVTTVAGQIMDFSGPGGPDQLGNDLNEARVRVDNFINDSIAIILQTFSGYTAEQVYALSYQEFLELLAMAERRLMAMGILQEPIHPVVPEQENAVPQEKFQDLNPPEPVMDPYHPPPKPVKKNKDLVVSSGEDGQMFNIPEGATAQDREVYMRMNAHKWKEDALEGLDLIYPDLMKKLADGEKITPETVRSTRGQTPQEVKAKHRDYKKAVTDGKIVLRPSQPQIALDQEEGAKPKARRDKG